MIASSHCVEPEDGVAERPCVALQRQPRTLGSVGRQAGREPALSAMPVLVRHAVMVADTGRP